MAKANNVKVSEMGRKAETKKAEILDGIKVLWELMNSKETVGQVLEAYKESTGRFPDDPDNKKVRAEYYRLKKIMEDNGVEIPELKKERFSVLKEESFGLSVKDICK